MKKSKDKDRYVLMLKFLTEGRSRTPLKAR